LILIAIEIHSDVTSITNISIKNRGSLFIIDAI